MSVLRVEKLKGKVNKTSVGERLSKFPTIGYSKVGILGFRIWIFSGKYYPLVEHDLYS
jgi:hypothetical protein